MDRGYHLAAQGKDFLLINAVSQVPYKHSVGDWRIDNELRKLHMRHSIVGLLDAALVQSNAELVLKSFAEGFRADSQVFFVDWLCQLHLILFLPLRDVTALSSLQWLIAGGISWWTQL